MAGISSKALKPNYAGHGRDPGQNGTNSKGGGKIDLYKDKQDNVYEKAKGNKGPGEPTGYNLNELDKQEEEEETPKTNTQNGEATTENNTVQTSSAKQSASKKSWYRNWLNSEEGVMEPYTPGSGVYLGMSAETAKPLVKPTLTAIVIGVLVVVTDGAVIPLIPKLITR